jgi:rSAM/selenodomain-associated transferase 2
VPAPVSVIIPSLNEQAFIGASVDSAFAAGAAEVIVADGGSSDRTIEVAEARGARVVLGEKMRSRQLNRGAEAASHDALLFLHADTLLPASGADAVVTALRNAHFGGFLLRFSEASVRLRLAERAINIRTRITRCPWGDQAQFIHRERFLRDGGFREIAIMEDYDLAVRMKRAGRSAVLPLHVVTSGRRFLDKGLLRTAVVNWRIIAAWRMGTDADELARLYRQ